MKSFINSIYKRKDEYCFIIKINKEKAKYLLSLNDPNNRDIDHEKIEKYIKIMDSGKWETRKGSFLGLYYFDKCLGDGQHRLNAFIRSELQELETFVCFG